MGAYLAEVNVLGDVRSGELTGAVEGGLGCVVEDEDAKALQEELQHGVAADVAGPELRQLYRCRSGPELRELCQFRSGRG